MADSEEAALASARAAYEAGDWAEAHRLFGLLGIDSKLLEPDDFERYGYAANLDGADTLDALERAVDAFEHAGRVHDAARIAIDVARLSAGRGQVPMAMAWSRRAERMLEGQSEGAGHAHVAVLQAFIANMSGKIAESLELSERAHVLAREHRDVDAESLALNRRGRLLIRLGRIEEGKADLDEAMLLVYSGRMRPIAAALVYCSTIDACSDMGDYERAVQWTEAAHAWIEKRELCGFPGVCRVHRAELLRLQGNRAAAREEALRAEEIFVRFGFRMNIGMAQAELGLGRLEDGDLEGAAEAFATCREMGQEPLPGAAILNLRRGDAPAARAQLDAALLEKTEDRLGRARLLPTLVEALLELGDVPAAEAAVDELALTAEQFGTVGLRAWASTAKARLHLHEQDGTRAVIAARAAVREWNVVGVAHEIERAKELLARAYALAGESARADAERAASDRAPNRLEAAETVLAPDVRAVTSKGEDAILPGLASGDRIGQGSTIDGKIDVGGLIGAGAMGVVYEGRHRITGRDVAVKVLRRRLCGDDEECARFLREALACGRIKHVNVVDVYDAGQRGGEPYIVMERLAGECLSNRLLRSRPSVDEALDIAEQMARGLGAAHAAGVIHRDLKPDNVFLAGGGGDQPVVKVLDFGISKLPEEGCTRAGALLGTPLYMAPEQVRDASKVDERSDIHAVGAVLFEMLAGRPPYGGNGVSGVLIAIANGAPADLAALNDGMPAAVIDVVGSALARDPAARPQTAGALADLLSAARRAI